MLEYCRIGHPSKFYPYSTYHLFVIVLADLFLVMPLGVYDGTLGMDWLKAHHANLCCHSRIISFLSLGNRVQVDGTAGKPKATLVKMNILL